MEPSPHRPARRRLLTGAAALAASAALTPLAAASTAAAPHRHTLPGGAYPRSTGSRRTGPTSPPPTARRSTRSNGSWCM